MRSPNLTKALNKLMLPQAFSSWEAEVKMFCRRRCGSVMGPSELCKLGRVYMEAEKYSEAQQIFQHVIFQYPGMDHMAQQYHGLSILSQKKSGGALRSLKMSSKRMKARLEMSLSRGQMLDTISKKRQPVQQVGLFAFQQKGDAECLQAHLNCLSGVIGHELGPSCFSSLTDAQMDQLWQAIVKSKVLKPTRLSKKCSFICLVLRPDARSWKTALEKERFHLEHSGSHVAVQLSQVRQLLSMCGTLACGGSLDLLNGPLRSLGQGFKAGVELLRSKRLVGPVELVIGQKQVKLPSVCQGQGQSMLLDFCRRLQLQSPTVLEADLEQFAYTEERFLADMKGAVVRRREVLVEKGAAARLRDLSIDKELSVQKILVVEALRELEESRPGLSSEAEEPATANTSHSEEHVITVLKKHCQSDDSFAKRLLHNLEHMEVVWIDHADVRKGLWAAVGNV